MVKSKLAPYNIDILRRTDIPGYESLEKLALDLRWTWHHSADKIWQQLNPILWESTRNPWIVLQTVSQEKLQGMLGDPEFSKLIKELEEATRSEIAEKTWYQESFSKPPVSSIAYFSMEFMLSEALPIYSGGLGNVAGDQLKSASDLGIPISAVGLLYQQGYFRQMIDKYGEQQALYPYNDPGQLPITPLRKPNGEWLRLEVALPGYSVWLRTWQVKVGRVKLYLLDSNDVANYPAHRGITSELYGGDSELRLKQELILGIAGWRLLEAIGIKPEVCHLNEGHAAFAVLERAKSFMKENGVSFEIALASTRAGNLFTTHTAVPAGFDLFAPLLIQEYLGNYAQNQLDISIDDLLALGRRNPKDQGENFNMAYLAVRGSGSVNGVSRLHGKVSRDIFVSLFPRWPNDEVPVGHVTNGVHMPSWDSAASDGLWTEICGKCRWLGKTEALEQDIRKISDEKIWRMRNSARRILVEYSRKRLAGQLAARGATSAEIEFARQLFDPNTLTLGFARRFATYKRPNMLLHDPDRLMRILTNPRYPVQLILAGKAHPADKPGQALIREWMRFIKNPQKPEARSHVIFLSDYDMLLTENLVQGVDVWLNTPRRPWEASGTSGMKILVNGGLNLSELDGWWAEAYTPEVGWAIGDGREHGEDQAWDAIEAAQLYDLLEKEIIPEFYSRNEEGIPTTWVAKIRESMARLTPQFSANRAVREYTEKYYIPCAKNYLSRADNKAAIGKEIVAWENSLKDSWSALRFGAVKVETKDNRHAFEVQVYLDDLDPNAVKVELYAEGLGEVFERYEMNRVRQLAADPGSYLYRASIPATSPADHYTPRVVPYFPNVAVPLEASEILWQK